MPKTLSDLPRYEELERFLNKLLKEKGDEIEFVVLFGSMARGDWSQYSDYDLLIGLRREDGRRLIDRISEFDAFVEGEIDVFPYSRSEWRWMFKEYHPLLLEALEYGLILWDRGAFGEMLKLFRRRRSEGVVSPWKSGWKISLPDKH